MRIITGDECGLLKETILPIAKSTDGKNNHTVIKDKVRTQRIISINNKATEDEDAEDDIQSRSRGIAGLTLLDHTTKNNDNDVVLSFASLRVNNQLEIWKGNDLEDALVKKRNTSKKNQTLNYVRDSTIHDVFQVDAMEDDLKSKPIGLQYSRNNDMLACCNSNGRISILPSPHDKKTTYESFPKCNNQSITSFAVGDTKMAVGGVNHEMIVLDTESGKQIWKGKNLPNDRQTLLEQQVWPSCIKFLNGVTDDFWNVVHHNTDTNTEAQQKEKDSLIMTGAGYNKQVRIYDISQQRRPILTTPLRGPSSKPIFHNRITSLSYLSSYQILAGDTAGYIFSIDIRNMKDVVARYPGPTGSMRCLDTMPSSTTNEPQLPIFAGISLDRFLYVFNSKTKKVLQSVYLKQRLSSMIICPTIDLPKGKTTDSDEEEEEDSDEDASSSDDDDDSSSFASSSSSSLEDIDDGSEGSDESSVDMRDDDSSVEEVAPSRSKSSSKKKRRKF